MPEAGAPVGDLDTATAVRRVSEGSWEAELDGRWGTGGGVNGGYLLVVAARAARELVPDKPDALAVSAHYAAATGPGPAQVHARVVHDGGTVATIEARLDQEQRTRVVVTITMGRLGSDAAPVSGVAQLPDLLPLEQCWGTDRLPAEHAVPFMSQVDLRHDPRFNGWVVGEPSGRPEIRSWMRLRDGREPDTLSLLLAADCLPPVTFEVGQFGWAPTVHISVVVCARPAPGWLRVTHRAQAPLSAYVDEDCGIWDSCGRLVAQSRQLALAPRAHVFPGTPKGV